jgi:hypothetical protein
MVTHLDCDGDFDSDYYLKESILKFEYVKNKESELVSSEMKVLFSSVSIFPEEAHEFICSMIVNDFALLDDMRVVVETFYSKEEILGVWVDMKDDEKAKWLYHNVGSRSISVTVDDDIKITSFGLIPEGFLKRLYKICSERWEDVFLTCKWYNKSEVECGVILIKHDILAEDMRVLDEKKICDAGYFVKGNEECHEIISYLNSKSAELLQDGMEIDDIRVVFENYKYQEKWIRIGVYFDNMYLVCLRAIETEDFKFPILSCKKIY